MAKAIRANVVTNQTRRSDEGKSKTVAQSGKEKDVTQ